MSHLSRSMDTCVGSPCAMERYAIAQNLGEGILDFCLNGALLGLALPAMKICPHILND
jgi:hypothetical protein